LAKGVKAMRNQEAFMAVLKKPVSGGGTRTKKKGEDT